jgi:hypothetical protein
LSIICTPTLKGVLRRNSENGARLAHNFLEEWKHVAMLSLVAALFIHHRSNAVERDEGQIIVRIAPVQIRISEL